jgi:membrane-associated protease RseP (regulator of RpoE activity)
MMPAVLGVVCLVGSEQIAWGQFQGLPATERALILGLGLGRASNSDFLRTIYALNTMEQNRIFRQQQMIRQQISAQRARADQARLSAALQGARRTPRYVPSPTVSAEERVSSDVLLCWEVFGATFLVVSPEEVFRIDPNFKGGMRVGAIRLGGPADRAGWEAGDVIVGLHKYRIRSYDNLAYIAELSDLVEITPLKAKYFRDGVLKEGTIDVLSRDAQPMTTEDSLKSSSTGPRRSVATPVSGGAEDAEATAAEAELLWNRIGVRARSSSIDRPGISFERGAAVVAVRPDSPASRAGVKSGEFLVGVNGFQIRNLSDLLWVCENPAISGSVSMVVVGSGEIRRPSIELPAIPTPPIENEDPSAIEKVPAEPALPEASPSSAPSAPVP